MGVQGEAVWGISSLLVHSGTRQLEIPPSSLWFFFLSLTLFSRPHQIYLLSFPVVALSPPLSLMALAVLLQCSGVALSSLVAFTAVYVEMVPTAPLHLVCSLLLLLSLQNFIQGEISN